MDDFERIQILKQELEDAILDAIKPILDVLMKVIDSLERYQKYEILHPKKKPRGSIRRSKK